MNEMNETPLPELDERIVLAAIDRFVRFGVRRTSMEDFAKAAGVSRQTLYDLFGNKDGLIRAAIRLVSDQSIQTIRNRLDACVTLEAALDLYLEVTVLASFELLQSAAEPEELISGHNKAGAEEIAAAHARQKALICEILGKHSGLDEAALTRLANFVVTVAMSFKYIQNKDELIQLLASLRDCTVATARQSQ